MKTYREMLQERADLVAEGREIFARAEREARELTAAEKARDDAINARLSALGEDIAREEARRERERSIGVAVPEGAVVTTKPGITGKPWGHEKGVRLIQQADGTMAFGGVKHAGEIALGSCLQAIARVHETGEVDPRLPFQAAASGGNTSNPAQGGFSVGTMLTMFLFGLGTEASKLLSMCNQIEIEEGSDGIEAPYLKNTSRATGERFGGVRVYRRKEADTVTKATPEEELFELRLSDLMGIAYQTERLMRDARAMGQIYATAFANEFAFVIDDEIVRGDGTGGEMQGILNSPALISVTKETGQAADTVTWKNLSDMWVRRSGPKDGLVWLYNSELEPQFDQLSIPVGTTALEPRFVNYGPDGLLRIKGRPVLDIEQASAPGDVGDIILANLNEFNVIRKGALEQAESDHVRFLYNERTFRWTMRINGKSHWRTAITPYKGSLTRSPFITLAAR